MRIDHNAAAEALQLLAVLIGEILVDEIESALVEPMREPFGSYPARLSQAGQDVAALAEALSVVARRARPRAGEGRAPS